MDDGVGSQDYSYTWIWLYIYFGSYIFKVHSHSQLHRQTKEPWLLPYKEFLLEKINKLVASPGGVLSLRKM